MGWFQEFLEVDKQTAFNFFLSGLRDVSDEKSDDEVLYVASVLAHYAQTSRYEIFDMPLLDGVSEVFDQFVMNKIDDPNILETAGAQTLFFAGFFRDHMQRRHNVKWYDSIGSSFYVLAGSNSKQINKRILFQNMSKSFPKWTLTCRDLNRYFREKRFLLKLN